ncbi:MAG: NADH-quinone oxidoreductase subunit H [Myxococcaceae bacterium]|nr:NADH-quinone oxidoreductase subunit H [Myxococcaceae bacterium]
MKKWIEVSLAIGFIIGALYGLMAAAYGLSGLLEGLLKDKFGVSGGAGFANLLVLMLGCVMVIATALTLAERKWSAMMQDRIGPNRATIDIGPLKGRALGGVPHIVTDVLKLLTKEDFQPATASKFLFNLGPILAFAPVFALFAIVPVGPTLEVAGQKVGLYVANPDFGLLYMLGIASLAVYGTSLAGWASNNKFALLGGVRASSQMISYEVALGLSLVGMMIAFGTVQLAGPTGMSEMQGHYLWKATVGGLDVGIPAWGFLLQPVGFILFFAAAFAETKRAPFDVPEGESEIIGYFVEYSGMKFGLFMIAEFVEVVVLSGVLTAIFFGGWTLPFGNEALASVGFFQDHPWVLGALFATIFWVKVILLCYLQLAIRWTFPRFRYDQIQTLGWKILLPMGLVNLFVTGALILWDPTLRSLAIAGGLEIALIAAVTLVPRGGAKDEHAEDHGHGGHGAHGATDAAAPALAAHH